MVPIMPRTLYYTHIEENLCLNSNLYPVADVFDCARTVERNEIFVPLLIEVIPQL